MATTPIVVATAVRPQLHQQLRPCDARSRRAAPAATPAGSEHFRKSLKALTGLLGRRYCSWARRGNARQLVPGDFHFVPACLSRPAPRNSTVMPDVSSVRKSVHPAHHTAGKFEGAEAPACGQSGRYRPPTRRRLRHPLVTRRLPRSAETWTRLAPTMLTCATVVESAGMMCRVLASRPNFP